ncbi:cytochrome P450 CYP72A219-like [Juglans microcarpa x Juglans regia]|uniref:cytochrome P450 CYP72A219-like n=1 Tax=Juglans microcarpa x Juglans regia TaxID=2249226 RepID=UPI001B7EC864|nr:cytochrome P450 CYP72A219-like [Juglans microcarpa x Juglans regia]
MEISVFPMVLSILVIVVLRSAWRALRLVWLKPKKLEKCMREQGFGGNSYRILFGDLKESSRVINEARSKPMNFTHDIAPRVIPFLHQSLKNYGKNFFTWTGTTPTVNIMNLEQVKDILSKHYIFRKPEANPLATLLATGLASYDAEKWTKHRKIINPAFHLEKLKNLLPGVLHQSCNDMISKWGSLVITKESGAIELDVWPCLKNLSSDIISRAAFGSSYEEGIMIFELQRELAELAIKSLRSIYIPGWRFLPTKMNKRMKEIDKQIQASLKGIINKREEATKAGEAINDDLLGILMESYFKEIQEHANNKNIGMNLQDVIEECKLFYLVGQETTSVLLVWTMILLSKYPNWQVRAREEVLQVFGEEQPDFDGLNHLKVVTMILYEVLRLYPPVFALSRVVHEDTKLGRLSLPVGVQVSLPIIFIHHDREVWGDDAEEFKPERFSDGVLKATKGQVSFFPFGWGPRICIGQNFAMIEAKMALSMILQRFCFELSPSYTHAPSTHIAILEPQYGAHIILRSVE